MTAVGPEARPVPPQGPGRAQLRTDDRYADSGIEHVGPIPARWAVRRADSILASDKVLVEPWNLGAEQVFHYSIPSVRETGDGEYVSPGSLDAAKLLITGDRLLVSKLNPRLGVVILASAKEVATICSTEFVPLRAVGCDLRWAFWLYSAELTRQRLSAQVRSATRSHQRAEVADITKMWHPVPGADEQTAIAVFLEGETAKIDAVVAERQRLIVLLRERRTALITRAVTKGLDASVAMKESGVAWLGSTPTHWAVKKIKHLLRAPLAYGILKPDKYVGADGVPLIRILDVESGSVRDDQLEQISPAQSLEYRRTIVAPGDLVVSVVGTIGRSFVVPHSMADANLSRALARMQFGAAANVRFMEYVLAAWPFLSFVDRVPGGTAQRVLNLGDLANYVLGVPQIVEQMAIVEWLDEKLRQLDALANQVLEAIRLLEEERTALISAAVTGKLDIRRAKSSE